MGGCLGSHRDFIKSVYCRGQILPANSLKNTVEVDLINDGTKYVISVSYVVCVYLCNERIACNYLCFCGAVLIIDCLMAFVLSRMVGV
jgi:hypothetical protein